MKPLAEVDVHPPQPALRASVPSCLRALPCSFTLIEVVVSLTLGVTLLVAVQGLLVGAYDAADEIESRAADTARRGLPFDWLRQDLESQPAGGGMMLNENVLAFTTLNALQSSRLAARHAVNVQYTIEPSDDGAYRLARRENELGRQNRKEPGVILLEGISELSFTVYDGRQWCDRWPPRVAHTAHAVRIAVVWPDGEQRQEIVPLTPPTWSRHDD